MKYKVVEQKLFKLSIWNLLQSNEFDESQEADFILTIDHVPQDTPVCYLKQ